MHLVLVAPKRRTSKTSILSSTSTVKQTKPTTLSDVDRQNQWNKFEEKHQGKPKRMSFTTYRAPSLSKSTTSSLRITKFDQQLAPIIPNIVAVPSYSLRSTAVCNPPDDEPISSERTQSIHADLSIFKYHLTSHEPKQPVKKNLFF